MENQTTPTTPQELLDRQEVREEDVNFQELACKALLKCSAEENAQVCSVILESLRDWHLQESKKPGTNTVAWVVDATRLDLALKTLNLVSWD